MGFLMPILIPNGSIYTPVHILLQIVGAAHVCGVCEMCFCICSRQSFFGKQKT